MFIHRETNETAFLTAHDNHEVTFTSTEGGKDFRTLPESEFFATHREATRDEIEAGQAAPEPRAEGGKGGKGMKDSGRQERHTRDE